MITLRQNLTLIASEPAYPGAPRWVLYDPLLNRYFRLHWQDVERIKALSPGSTTSSAQPSIHDAVSIDPSFIEFLQSHDLTQCDTPEARERLYEQHQRHQQLIEKQGLPTLGSLKNLLNAPQQALFFKCHLFNPDPLLDRLVPWLRPLTHPLVLRVLFGVVLTVTALGCLLSLRQWHLLQSSVAGLLTPSGMTLFLLTLVCVKVLHELGHAITAKMMGCSVPSIGVAMMVFWPILYTDTTDAWRLPKASQRAWIGAAGVLVEMVVALFCWVAFFILPEGPAKQVAFLFATVTWLVSLLVNLNPLMRFDGYFILSDLWHIENLQERAIGLRRWWIHTTLFGLNESPPETPIKGVIAYGFAAWFYRLFLFLTISALVYTLIFKLLALVMIAGYGYSQILKPLSQEAMHLYRHRNDLQSPSSLIITLSVVGLLIGAGFLPWSKTLYLPAVLEVHPAVPLYTQVDGQITSMAKAGARVAQGEPIVTQRAYDLEHQAKQIEQERRALQWQLAHHSVADGRLRAHASLQKELHQVEVKAQSFQHRLQRAVVVAPMDGVISDTLPHLQTGDWVAQGTQTALLISEAPAKITAYIDESSLQRLSSGLSSGLSSVESQQRVGRFQAEGGLLDPLEVTLSAVDSKAVDTLEQPYVASINGGEIPVVQDNAFGNDNISNDHLSVVGAFYRLFFHLDRAEENLQRSDQYKGESMRVLRGQIAISADSESFFSAMKRQVLGLWRREAGF